jgi:hypothetical protein
MKNRFYIVLTLLLFYANIAHSQKNQTEFCIDFVVNKTIVNPGFSNNAARIEDIIDFLQEIRKDSTISIIEVSFTGAASPEGSDQLNRGLARGRLAALENIIRKEVYIPDSIISRNDSHIPWSYLLSQIESSDLLHKDEVIAIIKEEARLVNYHRPNAHVDNRVVKLMRLHNGKVWQQMLKQFFAPMRNACAVIITYKNVSKLFAPAVESVSSFKVAANLPNTIPAVKTIVPEIVDAWTPKLYIKTNAIALGMAIANIAGEIDLAKHWSFTLPIYYSAWDYFKATVKFRTFAVQPEFRYWPSADNNGFFTGAHFGLAYYNFAFNGAYRYQDHNRNTPSIGGGLSVGYRLPIRKSSPWQVEFSLGAGVYSRHYDIFHNTSRTKDGLIIKDIKKTYWGIDQASISFAYMFDLNKKGGKL